MLVNSCRQSTNMSPSPNMDCIRTHKQKLTMNSSLALRSLCAVCQHFHANAVAEAKNSPKKTRHVVRIALTKWTRDTRTPGSWEDPAPAGPGSDPGAGPSFDACAFPDFPSKAAQGHREISERSVLCEQCDTLLIRSKTMSHLGQQNNVTFGPDRPSAGLLHFILVHLLKAMKGSKT